MREGAKERGDDPDELPRAYAALINAAIDDRPDDLTICIHLCRGNFRSAWVAEGSYEPVPKCCSTKCTSMPISWNMTMNAPAILLRCVLCRRIRRSSSGWSRPKSATLESADDLKRRVDEAANYMPLDNCASVRSVDFPARLKGNEITEDSQWAKLELVVNTAREIWG